jgi:DNA-binding NtrC family response regulator
MAMPEMTGDQALPLIAKSRPDIRVIVSSGFGGTDVKRHFEAMKVHAFLPKPYNGDQLLAHVLPALAEWSEGQAG